jgi:hypothetical protein
MTDVWVNEPRPPEVEAGPGQGEWVITGGPGRAPPIRGPQQEIADTNLQTGKDAARGAGMGATFNTLPYLTAAIPDEGKDYWSKVAAGAQAAEAASERSPFAYGFGNLAGSAAVPMGVASRGAMIGEGGGLLGRTLWRGPLEGATYGGLGGAGSVYNGNPEDYAAGAGRGMLLGSATGLAGPAIGAFASPLGPRMGDLFGGGERIPKALAQAAQTDRAGLEAIARGELGPRAMLTEGGPSMLGTAQGATPGGAGPGRAALINALTARNQETNPYIAGEMDRLFGAARTPSVVQQQVQRDIDTLSPRYDRAYENARAIDNTGLADWIGGRIGSTRGPAQAALREVRGMLDIPGNVGTLDPHPRALGAARSAVRGMRDSADDPAVRRELGLVYDQMTRELQAKVPGIRQLDSVRAELGSRFDALDPGSAGSRMFEAGRQGVIRPDELRDVMTEAARPKGTLTQPSQEPSFLREAARAELDRIVGTNRNDLAKLRQVLAEPQDYNQQKLAVMFGQDRADGIARVLNQEHRFRDSYNKVVENSQTAQRTAAVKAQEADTGAGLQNTSMWGMGVAAVNKALNRFQEGAAGASRDRIAQILATRDPQQVRARIPELLAAQPTRDARSRLVRDLVQSGFIGGTTGFISK